ncbi:YeeE/YedE family protein [Radiobacillus kanasensis]|uniref:YeeE/YedE family protein n=1 Tax=Radiobacillus kanasensis TaxID=2844358 RepID=UPI001E48DC8C|nr:YeeE/YedE family protein [Radiobacillus kanasensis]UFU00738.1 YeeE/YedE family protein [Radiobacillus kanasensis]
METAAKQVTENKKRTFIGELSSPQKVYLVGGIIAAIIITILSSQQGGVQLGVQVWIGLSLGFTLFHARFGFTSAFRRLMSIGNGEGIRAHMIMLAVASGLFAIIFAIGKGFFGVEPAGYVSPVGVSVIVGSFLFGIGMQLGNGCASGTLYSLGGGRGEMVITLIGFIIGSVLGAWHWGFWVQDMPSFAPISLGEQFGYFNGWLLQFAFIALIFWATKLIEKKKQPPKIKPLPQANGWLRILKGSWPLWAAALVLAVLNAITLLVRGNPWGVTSAFALWGSKTASAIGIDVTTWDYWSRGNAGQLEASIFADSTTILNFGVIIGALLASAAGGLFILKKIPIRIMLAAIIGGVLMGYGARIAFGCNIGAYFGGIASLSIHGWVWAVFALAGSYLSLYLRPLFSMSVPKKGDHFC